MDHRTMKTTCACCIAAMLLGGGDAAEGQSFLGRYAPDSDVADVAALDLDQRSIVARLAAESDDGLREAEDVYVNGRISGDQGNDTLTIKSLSTRADDSMGGKSATYDAYKEYYGRADYADHWLRAGFDDGVTEFAKSNADFTKLDLEGRVAAIRYGTAVLNVWINVVGRLEMAASQCTTVAEPIVGKQWDEAVALYTGSIAANAADGTGGEMVYNLAQVECAKFGTCDKGKVAPLNEEIFDAFVDGRAHLRLESCDEAARKAARIKSLATVPLVQGAIRSMYALDVEENPQGTTQGAGAAFAAALLPLVNGCSSGNANIVWTDLAPGEGPGGSFEVVKAALERSYDCLGVSCSDVGGIVNYRGDGYLAGAEPCSDVTWQPKASTPTGGGTTKEDEEDATDPKYWDYSGEWDYRMKGDVDYSANKESSEGSSEDYQSGGAHNGQKPKWFEQGGMDAQHAALLSGLVFGVLGLVMGAVIACACKGKEEKKAEKEFVAPTTIPSNGLKTDDENGDGLL